MSHLPLTTLAERACKAKGIDVLATVDTRAIRLINRLFRDADEAHLYPFVPATERAIRWYSRVYFKANGPCSVLEYIHGLDGRIGDFVNGRA